MELIGVPFDLSGKTLGSRLGPAAIRLAGVTETLGKLGIPLKDGTDIPVLAPSEMPSRAGGLRNFHAALDCVRTICVNASARSCESRTEGAPSCIASDRTACPSRRSTQTARDPRRTQR